MSDDKIVRTTLIEAPVERVWRALANAKDFSEWFGMALDREIAPNTKIWCTFPKYPQFGDLKQPMVVERVEPNRLLTFRWHPYAIEKGRDYEAEPMTLVELALEPAPGGTKLTVTESGFDQIPADRRAKAFEMNGHGWTEQMGNIKGYVARQH